MRAAALAATAGAEVAVVLMIIMMAAAATSIIVAAVKGVMAVAEAAEVLETSVGERKCPFFYKERGSRSGEIRLHHLQKASSRVKMLRVVQHRLETASWILALIADVRTVLMTSSRFLLLFFLVFRFDSD